MPSLKEIRSKYPMYSDMPDDAFAKAFHQKFYSDLPFQDFSKKVGYLKGADPSEYDTDSPEWKAKYGPTSGMSGMQKFAAGWGKSLVDLGRGAGQLVGAVDREDVAEARKRDAPLMESGLGKAGNITGSIANLVPAAFIPGANTVAGAAAIGAGAGLLQPSTSTKETLTNTGLGGVLSPAAMVGGRGLVGLGRGIKSAAIDPFTKAGQSRVASQAFQGFAGGADEAAKAAQNIRSGMADVLPGVEPTTAELAQNAGLAQLERNLKNNPEFTQSFANRAQGNRNAMVDAIEGIAGDSGKRAAAEATREAVTSPLYKSATKATYTVDGDLAGLLNRPVVKQAMERAKTLAQNQGREFSFETKAKGAVFNEFNPYYSNVSTGNNATRISGQGLQDIKMAMDEMLSDPSSGFTGSAGNTVKDLRGQIIGWMEKANPDFNAARTQHAALSKPINQMEIGQTLRDKLLPAMTDFGANTRLRPQAFAQAMREGDATAAKAMGRPYGTMDEIMEPGQMKSLKQIGQQLGRRVNADELGRAVGSNTGQNLVGQNVLRQMLGPMGLPQKWSERVAASPIGQGVLGLPAKLAEKATGTIGDPNIMRKLVEIGLSPEEAIKVLESQAVNGPGLLKYQGLMSIGAGQSVQAGRQK